MIVELNHMAEDTIISSYRSPAFIWGFCSVFRPYGIFPDMEILVIIEGSVNLAITSPIDYIPPPILNKAQWDAIDTNYVPFVCRVPISRTEKLPCHVQASRISALGMGIGAMYNTAGDKTRTWVDGVAVEQQKDGWSN